MPHTRELHLVTKNEREIKSYFCHRLRRNKKTERKERERKREEREKDSRRKTERETERKETGRRERGRVPFGTDSAETRNKTKTFISFCDESREPPHHPKLL